MLNSQTTRKVGFRVLFYSQSSQCRSRFDTLSTTVSFAYIAPGIYIQRLNCFTTFNIEFLFLQKNVHVTPLSFPDVGVFHTLEGIPRVESDQLSCRKGETVRVQVRNLTDNSSVTEESKSSPLYSQIQKPASMSKKETEKEEAVEYAEIFINNEGKIDSGVKPLLRRPTPVEYSDIVPSKLTAVKKENGRPNSDIPRFKIAEEAAQPKKSSSLESNLNQQSAPQVKCFGYFCQSGCAWLFGFHTLVAICLLFPRLKMNL